MKRLHFHGVAIHGMTILGTGFHFGSFPFCYHVFQSCSSVDHLWTLHRVCRFGFGFRFHNGFLYCYHHVLHFVPITVSVVGSFPIVSSLLFLVSCIVCRHYVIAPTAVEIVITMSFIMFIDRDYSLLMVTWVVVISPWWFVIDFPVSHIPSASY